MARTTVTVWLDGRWRLLKPCRQIAGDAFHGERADRFHPSLFHGLEGGGAVG